MTSASLLHFLVDWIISIAVTLVLKKTVKRPYLGRFKPDLAQILAKGWPSQPLGLLFYKKIGLLLEKTPRCTFVLTLCSRLCFYFVFSRLCFYFVFNATLDLRFTPHLVVDVAQLPIFGGAATATLPKIPSSNPSVVQVSRNFKENNRKD